MNKKGTLSQGVLNLIINKTTELSSITNDIYLESSRIIKSDFIPTTVAYNVSEKRQSVADFD